MSASVDIRTPGSMIDGYYDDLPPKGGILMGVFYEKLRWKIGLRSSFLVGESAGAAWGASWKLENCHHHKLHVTYHIDYSCR